MEIWQSVVKDAAHIIRETSTDGVIAAAPCSSTSRRLFITDRNCKIQFLVNTGSDVCLYSRLSSSKYNLQSNYTLSTANGTQVRTYGDIVLHLNFGFRRTFTWRFLIADVTMPILGADFLAHYDIIVDIKNSRLYDIFPVSSWK